MAYQIIRNQSGWILNDEGQVLVKDVERQDDIWVDNNIIYFNGFNEPCIKIKEGRQELEHILTFLWIDSESVNEDAVLNNVEAKSSDNTENLSPHKTTWTYESTMALITSVESRYEDLFHVHKKKTFWNVIHEELLSQGLNFPPKTCQKKWENLVRTYKSSKDLKTKTGRGPTKFMFFNRMDEILGDTPTNSSPHSIDVCNISQVESTHQDSNSNVIEECTPSIGKRKRQTATMQYITMKKRYFEAKEKENAEKSERKMSYLEEMVTLKKVRNELTRKKLELEERKVVALERLAFTTATD